MYAGGGGGGGLERAGNFLSKCFREYCDLAGIFRCDVEAVDGKDEMDSGVEGDEGWLVTDLDGVVGGLETTG